MNRHEALSLQIGDILICNPDVHDADLHASGLSRKKEYRVDAIIPYDTEDDPELTGVFLQVTSASGTFIASTPWRSAAFFVKKTKIN